MEALRNRQIKNFIAVLMLAAGTPMLLMGDEARRTQRGNNNAYCLDDDLNWFDWSLLERHADVHRFVKAFAAFRQRRDVVAHAEALSLNQLLEHSRLDWHGVRLGHPDWNDNSHALAFTLRSFHSRFVLHAMLNAYWEPLEFEVPASGRNDSARMAALGRHGGATAARRAAVDGRARSCDRQLRRAAAVAGAAGGTAPGRRDRRLGQRQLLTALVDGYLGIWRKTHGQPAFEPRIGSATGRHAARPGSWN